jgi:hypothetical protein
VNKEDKIMDFSKFDEMVDSKALKEQMDAAPEYDEVPAGRYVCSIEAMEVKETKAQDKLMFSLQCKITENKGGKGQVGRWIFFNRVICGNKTSEKWNDGIAIKGICSFVNEILGVEEGAEDALVFTKYTQFADDIADIAEEVKGVVELEVTYDPKAFNPIKIEEVFDI